MDIKCIVLFNSITANYQTPAKIGKEILPYIENNISMFNNTNILTIHTNSGITMLLYLKV